LILALFSFFLILALRLKSNTNISENTEQTTISENTEQTTIPENTEQTTSNKYSFYCGTFNGKPVTMVQTSRGNIPMIIYQSNNIHHKKEDIEKYCQKVSGMFNFYHEINSSLYLTAGIVNGYPVICAVNTKGGTCNVLIELNIEDDAQNVLKALLDTRNRTSFPVINIPNNPELIEPSKVERLIISIYEARDQKNYEIALDLIKQAIKIEPDNANLYLIAGNISMEQKKHQEAINYYQKAIAINPDFVTAQNNLKEAKRLLSIQTVSPVINDLAYLPNIKDEPLVPYLRSTARIIVDNSQDQNTNIGTGWVMKREDNTLLIVTNRHVILNSSIIPDDPKNKQISVEFYSELPDGKRHRYPATIDKITDKNDQLDLAVLKVTGIPDDIKPFTLKSGRIARDSDIKIIGHPFNVSIPWTVVTGKVMNYSQNQDTIPLDVTVAEGNSGGPVINEKGKIVAMMVSIQGFGDINSDPNISTPLIPENTNVTGGIGLAYRIDVIIEQLKKWGYEM
jgi:superkiller protein 3